MNAVPKSDGKTVCIPVRILMLTIVALNCVIALHSDVQPAIRACAIGVLIFGTAYTIWAIVRDHRRKNNPA